MASGDGDPWEYSLRKYLLLLATLVATVTYAAGFNPPGGVWQDTDAAAGRLAGDPIIRDTSYRRYLVFFYCNATAFASSLVVIVLILILSFLHEHGRAQEHQATGGTSSKTKLAPLHSLRVVMTLDLLSIMGAYAAGSCRDAITAAYSGFLVLVVVAYVAVHTVRAWGSERKNDSELERPRKVLMLLATFAMSVTYLAGLSAPGGFWGDDAGGGHRPGDAVLLRRHDARLKAFFVCNNTAFAASLLIVVLLLDKKLQRCGRLLELYGFIFVALVGLVGAYTAGSCRQIDTTVYVSALVDAIKSWNIQMPKWMQELCCGEENGSTTTHTQTDNGNGSDGEAPCCGEQNGGATLTENGSGNDKRRQAKAMEKARSLVLLLATLAATITYQAGLDPPGGLWQDDGDGHMAGDPILWTTNSRRYKAFFYCNSVAFVASLVAIVLVQQRVLLDHHALEAAMILDLFGLIGAYAAGSCRDVTTSIYAMALAGAVLVYVVIHVVFLTMDHEDDVHGRGSHDVDSLTKEKEKEAADEVMEKRRKRLLLFEILAATITYQAGLTPPSGFRLQDDGPGHRAGDPVLLYNYPRRYKAFFYCNSVSFMLSIALIILLVNRNLYRPAIRSHALSVCTAAGMFGLMGAYAAGSTQHLKTSIYIFALAAVVLSFVVLLVVVFLVIHTRKGHDKNVPNNPTTEVAGVETPPTRTEEPSTGEKSGKDDDEKKLHAKRKYLMLLGILVASVTYQAGLEPPGGVWQGDGGGHVAGDSVMHDNRRPRYLAFFYSNSTSFVASVVVIILLLAELLRNMDRQEEKSESPQKDKAESLQMDDKPESPQMDDKPESPQMDDKPESPQMDDKPELVQEDKPKPESQQEDKPESQKRVNWWLGVMNTTIVLDLLGLLVAYAAGSSRSWRRTGYVFALVVAVLTYVAIHVALSCLSRWCNKRRHRSSSRGEQAGEDGHPALDVSR
ncbi:hypothetical protein ACP70R_018205 [Stipagrostis hirtigluma subsp. patula]